MDPLYPHLYTTLIVYTISVVLRTTFTSVGLLARLPTDEKKAPSGFLDAVRALHRENEENLFPGLLTTPESDDHASRYELRYYCSTGSDMRRAGPTRWTTPTTR